MFGGSITSNFVWYWPFGDHYARFFVAPFLGFAAAALLVLAVARFVPKARPAVCLLAFAVMPVLGIVHPMVPHQGDPWEWEMAYYVHERAQWKAGELFGTLPFHLLAHAFPVLHEVGEAPVAVALSIFGFVGAAGFLAFAVDLARGLGPSRFGIPPGTPFFAFFRRLALGDLGCFYLLSFATLSPFLVYGGFVQTTYVANVALPWALLLLHRALRTMPSTGRLGLVASWASIACAWIAAHALVLAHASALVVLLGALATAAWGAVDLLRGARTEPSPGLRAAWNLTLPAALLLTGGRVVAAITLHYRRVVWTPWHAELATIAERILAARAVTHVVPRWVPWLGQDHPLCGQQTVFLSGRWLLFSVASVVQGSCVAVLLAFLLVGWVRRRAGGAGGPEAPRSDPASRRLIASWAILGLGFIACYSPHFSQPVDMDLLFIPGALLSIFVIATFARPDRTRWMVAIAIGQALLLGASWAAQRGLQLPAVRGVSGPWC